ncbi:MAG: hypothetical protein M0Q24_02280 [Sulfurimonas sp.]|uniref:surface lipoprotein assembly modifier n=1 Tax=Sulfurimonas sp. TaxID=2022749 RepID=UPI0025F10B00|nr:hypothetical protein [Sulfurimonas sp.]MCK9490891.1 hypothetical protein [Sulfurimonas sp.]
MIANVTTKANFSAEYEKATKLYKSKNYKEAYEIFSKIYLSSLSDAKLSFYLGHSAYETGHYEIALAAFERVEILEPTNLRNKLEKARTYFMLKMYEEAQNSFEEVLNSPMIPKNVRTNIELYIAKITGAQKKSFTYATLNIDWLYDSNVNYGSLDDTYNIGSTAYPTAEVRADRALQTSLDLVNIYDFGDANGFALKNRAFAYLKDYKKEDDFDIAYLAYMPSLLYKESRYSAEMVVGFETMNLASKNYLRSIHYMPKLDYSHTNTLRSIVYFKYQRKFFQQAAYSDLNSNHCELSYGLQTILTPRSYLQANIVGIKEKKRQASRIDVDYDEYKLNAIYANHFSAIYSAEIYGEIKKRQYEDFSNLFESTRVDESKIISLSLGARILQTLRLNAKVSYNRVDSNQNLFSYQKHTFSLGLTKTF